MKRLLQLHIQVAQDMGDQLGVDPTRDISTLISRYQEEGDGFLLVSLPMFEEGLLASLSQGNLSPSLFPGFRFKRGLPVFLRGFLEKIFSPDGSVSGSASADAVFAVRQITAISKKIERRVSPSVERKAEEAFRATDEGVIEDLPPIEASNLDRVFNALFRAILTDIDGAVARFELVPRHGPGAVAERMSGKEKWDFPHWLEALESTFPSSLYTSHDGLRGPRPVVTRNEEPPVRVSFVPKTVRSPRVIAIEPYARQFAQQAIARRLYKGLRSSFPHQLDLFDQTNNQRLAKEGSITGQLATIDLSEASDRLPYALVSFLTRSYPHLHDAIEACRSGKALLPGGDIISLKKFASMGSALTFPIQSMVFFAISVLANVGDPGPLTPGDIRRLTRASRISVFGDDIIVPNHSYLDVCSLLEDFGLKVNSKKSYGSGYFRESCGGDFFMGDDVTIVRLRKDPPASRRDAQAVSSFVSFRNRCYLYGMWRTARWCDELLTRTIKWLPAPVDHPSLSRWTFLQVPPDYIREDVQVEMIRRPKLVPIGNSYRVDGLEGLLKWFLDKEHTSEPVSPFETAERPITFAIHDRGARLHM